MTFAKLETFQNNLASKHIVKKAPFIEVGKIPNQFVKEAFVFSYKMTFGEEGAHRDCRSGGTHHRNKSEIFSNTFLGKLCEFALYLELNGSHEINKPDLTVCKLGVWDKYDFKIDDKTVSLKSTKSFGQLLLLEKKDWTSEGEYIPNNNEKYDFTFMVRLKNDPETIIRENGLILSDNCDFDKLWDMFSNNDWSYDIPRYISHHELKYLINNDFVIYKGDTLNGKTVVDADNYYCHIADMHKLKKYSE